MRPQSLLVAAAVVLSAALISPVDSAAQRQHSPNGNNGGGNGGQRQNGGGGQQRESGGGRQRESGGGARQRESGGGGQRSDAGARQQDSGRAQARVAQPRDRGGDRNNGGRREAPPVVRESAPPPQRPQARTESAPVEGQPRAQRRFPNAADRTNADAGNVTRNRGDRGNVVQGADGGNVVRGDNRVRGNNSNGGATVRNGTGRVAVPRTGPPPQRYYDRNDRNVYGSYYGGRAVYGRYAYRGARNIYIVPYGRTYHYYPRYYYNSFAFGYGPGGRGHFYFDLHYNSYIWHPYSVYRYGSYGTYGYPVGELRLKVHPRDAQVYIDGYYAGRVDDFDGVFQSLRLEEGEYQVEIVLPGYEPLAFDVRIFPGEKTTYEGDLIPE
jgi:PEGA domain